ncbi:hypothetical protein Y032_0003g1506 [Ancylostoma ceylanicum]|uniref:Uncharacterized protein n=1 Tax=Ancylostoma ceylanicum TaxID=53326 RepID=A0A016VY92_9BILA|nr:hypothetical protein Y032_0003g1506 [Ancylostoma ceylanicum]
MSRGPGLACIIEITQGKRNNAGIDNGKFSFQRNAAVLLDANAVRAAPARRTVRAARKAANAVQTASAVTANAPVRSAARATRSAVKRVRNAAKRRPAASRRNPGDIGLAALLPCWHSRHHLRFCFTI